MDRIRFQYAQTNLQLYNQARDAGWPSMDLLVLTQAYKLACLLFSGLFRSSGKCFISHSVGTASVLMTVTHDVEIVAAGLLHATYAQGNFGTSLARTHSDNRQIVEAQLSSRIEDLIFSYNRMPWSAQDIQNMHDNFDKVTAKEKEILLLRLANEVDDYADLGMLYASKVRPRFNQETFRHMESLSQKLGYPYLSQILNQVFRETEDSVVPDQLKAPNSMQSSYLIQPGTTLSQIFNVTNDQINTK